MQCKASHQLPVIIMGAGPIELVGDVPYVSLHFAGASKYAK